jgi:ACT domain-containing protein
VARYLLRIRLPDRPGALRLVASRIGAVGGDIVAIEILGRDEGRAIDEFVVELAQPDLLPLLSNEIHEVDGVGVEEITPIAAERAVLDE